MKYLDFFLNYLKGITKFNLKLKDFIMNLYFRSIFYRKKHIRNDNYKWLKDVNLSLINKNEGKLTIGKYQFNLPKNIKGKNWVEIDDFEDLNQAEIKFN